MCRCMCRRGKEGGEVEGEGGRGKEGRKEEGEEGGRSEEKKQKEGTACNSMDIVTYKCKNYCTHIDALAVHYYVNKHDYFCFHYLNFQYSRLICEDQAIEKRNYAHTNLYIPRYNFILHEE